MNPDQSLNELEINLRRLPGVMAVAFEERNAVLHIQLHIGGRASDSTLTDRATRLALQFATGSVAVEVNHWQGSRQFSSQQAGAVANHFGGGHVGDAPDPRDAVVESETNRREPNDTETVSSRISQAAGQAEKASVSSERLSNRRRSDAGAARDSKSSRDAASSKRSNDISPKNGRLDADAPFGEDGSEPPEVERRTFVSTSHPSSNWESTTGSADDGDTGARSGPDSRDRTRSEPDTRSFLSPDTEPLDAHSDEIFARDTSLLETGNEEVEETEEQLSARQDDETNETNESFNDDREHDPSSVIDVSEMEQDESLGRVPRTRLLAVLTFPDTDELEVHLSYKGSRGIGRAPASRGVLGASEAAIEALRTWAPDIEYTAIWARPIENGGGAQSYLVATELDDPNNKTLHGLAAGASAIEAAARATLHALNRTIAPALALIPEQS